MKRASFKELIERSRRPLGQRLLERAYAANKLAKACQGPTRRHLYSVKHRCLSRAIEIMPDSFYVDSQVENGRGVILGVRSYEGFSFHIPESGLSHGARVQIGSM
jgi:hypothetical protein